MRVTESLVELLNELFGVVVNRVAAKHLEAEDLIIKTQVIIQLGKNDAEWAQTIAVTLSKKLWIA